MITAVLKFFFGGGGMEVGYDGYYQQPTLQVSDCTIQTRSSVKSWQVVYEQAVRKAVTGKVGNIGQNIL